VTAFTFLKPSDEFVLVRSATLFLSKPSTEHSSVPTPPPPPQSTTIPQRCTRPRTWRPNGRTPTPLRPAIRRSATPPPQ
jgi:hypothetical protein